MGGWELRELQSLVILIQLLRSYKVIAENLQEMEQLADLDVDEILKLMLYKYGGGLGINGY
jgi:hypothetical protein